MSGDRPLAPCGTYAAYARHKRAGEVPDEACRDAGNTYKRRSRTGTPHDEKLVPIPARLALGAVRLRPAPAEQRHAATLTVCHHARGVDDARRLLDIVGLLPGGAP